MATWHTVATLKRQYIAAEVTNANGFAVTLPGATEWTNPKFFISIKEITLPLVMSSLTYNITKVGVNQYRIQPIIEGSVEKVYQHVQTSFPMGMYWTPKCYGFNLSLGASGYNARGSGGIPPNDTSVYNEAGTRIVTFNATLRDSARENIDGNTDGTYFMFVSDYSITTTTPQKYGIRVFSGSSSDYYQSANLFIQCYEYAQYVATDAKLTVLCIEQ